jgi:hypothetical protein
MSDSHHGHHGHHADHLIENPANFCEWGFYSEELGTPTPATFIHFLPIIGLKFKWYTKRPDYVEDYPSWASGQIYGVGEYTFETFHLVNHVQMQNAFLSQKILKKVEFHRFMNYNGERVQMASYTAHSCIITNYEFHYGHGMNYHGEKYKITIQATGDNQFNQIIRNNGLIVGNVITTPYDTSYGSMSETDVTGGK